jgi:hypothetical protein
VINRQATHSYCCHPGNRFRIDIFGEKNVDLDWQVLASQLNPLDLYTRLPFAVRAMQVEYR